MMLFAAHSSSLCASWHIDVSTLMLGRGITRDSPMSSAYLVSSVSLSTTSRGQAEQEEERGDHMLLYSLEKSTSPVSPAQQKIVDRLLMLSSLPSVLAARGISLCSFTSGVRQQLRYLCEDPQSSLCVCVLIWSHIMGATLLNISYF